MKGCVDSDAGYEVAGAETSEVVVVANDWTSKLLDELVCKAIGGGSPMQNHNTTVYLSKDSHLQFLTSPDGTSSSNTMVFSILWHAV